MRGNQTKQTLAFETCSRRELLDGPSTSRVQSLFSGPSFFPSAHEPQFAFERLRANSKNTKWFQKMLCAFWGQKIDTIHQPDWCQNPASSTHVKKAQSLQKSKQNREKTRVKWAKHTRWTRERERDPRAWDGLEMHQLPTEQPGTPTWMSGAAWFRIAYI